eukprot:m.15072 g.15072  ORF g.15072 m.15072 type:complete len:817 (+) comp6504_c0_seq1:213-2663(+)
MGLIIRILRVILKMSSKSLGKDAEQMSDSWDDRSFQSALDEDVASQTKSLSKSKAYREQREQYEQAKKTELTKSSYELPLIKSGVLKVRNQLRKWIKLNCELRHGVCILKRDAVWFDTLMLAGGDVMPRPSRKYGYCFKFFQPHKVPIHLKGPHGEGNESARIVLPSDHVIFRAATEQEGLEWICAFRQAIFGQHPDYEAILQMPATGFDQLDLAGSSAVPTLEEAEDRPSSMGVGSGPLRSQDTAALGLRADTAASDGLKQSLLIQGKQQQELEVNDWTEEEPLAPSLRSAFPSDYTPPSPPVAIGEVEWALEAAPSRSTSESIYQHQILSPEQHDEIWSFLSQHQHGATISRLPLQMSQRKSVLERFSDNFAHADFLTDAAKHKLPLGRFTSVVRWVMSMFYNKDEGLARPIAPVLGEVFRCCFQLPSHNKTPSSRAFFLAQAVTAHPEPTFAFVATNARCGWKVTGSLKYLHTFFGNTLVSHYKGTITVHLLQSNESFDITLPSTVTTGLLLGDTYTNLNGTVQVSCSQSNLEFQATFAEESKTTFNGTIQHTPEGGSGTVALLHGSYDETVFIKAPDADRDTALLSVAGHSLFGRRLTKMVVQQNQLWTYKSNARKFDSASAWYGALFGANPSLGPLYQDEAKRASTFTSDLFVEESGAWRCIAATTVVWDFERDVYQYQEQTGFIKTLTLDELSDFLMYEDDGQPTVESADQPAMRRRLISSKSFDTDGPDSPMIRKAFRGTRLHQDSVDSLGGPSGVEIEAALQSSRFLQESLDHRLQRLEQSRETEKMLVMGVALVFLLIQLTTFLSKY